MTTSFRLVVTTAMTFALSCAGQQKPREGVYAVVSRTCQGPHELEIECTRVRYIEIVRGRFYGVANQQLAIVKWMAQDETGPYVYSARVLGGGARDADVYLVDEWTSDVYAAREWLVLSDNQPKEYGYGRQPLAAAPASKENVYLLKLAPVERDAVLTERIPYPPPIADE